MQKNNVTVIGIIVTITLIDDGRIFCFNSRYSLSIFRKYLFRLVKVLLDFEVNILKMKPQSKQDYIFLLKLTKLTLKIL